MFKKLVTHFAEYKCVACGVGVLHKKALCYECLKNLSVINQTSICKKCGRYCLADVCIFCTNQPPVFTKALAYCVYNSSSAQIIKQFKYHNNTLCTQFMVQSMQPLVAAFGAEVDAITTVPMNGLKEFWKSYNHAARLARGVAAGVNIAYFPFLLKKRFTWKRQAVSNKAERHKNVQGIFKVNRTQGIEGKNILLIDDATTTGATANECAKVLFAAGAKNVFLLTFAKSIKDEEILAKKQNF